MFYAISLILFSAVLIPHNTMASLPELSASINSFSSDFYKTVAAEDSGNLIMSPLSAQTVLALVYMGAGGNTATQMAQGLHLNLEKKTDTQNDFNSLMNNLNSQQGVTLNIANKVYVMTGYTMKDAFLEIATKKFQAEAENINFAENTKSAKTINTWVEGKTNNKIKDLVEASALSSDSRMVLVNAIYFKGAWAKKFDPALTKDGPFYTSETEFTQVPMMHLNKKFRYADLEDMDAQVVELPYANSDLSMLIILPNSKTGLSALEKKLETVSLQSISQKMYEYEVNLSLPKFKIESTIKLVEKLKKLGMTDMFGPSADFSGLLNSPEPLYVSEVVQKAFIEVNEEGAEAAAATGTAAIMMVSAVITKRVSMTVDHPFVFVLKSTSWNRDARSNLISPLFLGRIQEIPPVFH